jgi:hypothetical protein
VGDSCFGRFAMLPDWPSALTSVMVHRSVAQAAVIHFYGRPRIYLMQALMGEVHFEEGGTVVEMCKKRNVVRAERN